MLHNMEARVSWGTILQAVRIPSQGATWGLEVYIVASDGVGMQAAM